MRKFLIAVDVFVSVTVGSSSLVFAGPYEDGKSAYDKKDYACVDDSLLEWFFLTVLQRSAGRRKAPPGLCQNDGDVGFRSGSSVAHRPTSIPATPRFSSLPAWRPAGDAGMPA